MEQAVAEVEVIELTAAAAPFDDVDVQQWARHVFQEVGVQRVSRAAGKPHSSAAGAGGGTLPPKRRLGALLPGPRDAALSGANPRKTNKARRKSRPTPPIRG